jgi:uncharacterized protein (TIGR03067 family)
MKRDSRIPHPPFCGNKQASQSGFTQKILYAPAMSSMDQLHGVWQAISAVVSGEALPNETVETIRLTLTATQFTTRRGGEILFDSSYTIDVTKTPNEIEMIGIGDFEGKPALGIYALDGEILQLCYRMPGYLRPIDFNSLPGSGAFLIMLKRLKS